MEMHKRVGGFWTAMIMDTRENRCWPSLGCIFRPDEFRLEGLSRTGATGKWLSGCCEFTRSRIPGSQLAMEWHSRDIIDDLYWEARTIAEDWGDERTPGVRDEGHGEVRAEEPRHRGDLMGRSDSHSTNDEAEHERVILVPVKPMPQWRPHSPGHARRDG
jgi:hypothetical protein